MNQNGYHPQGMQGYGQQPPLFSQNGQGYNNPVPNGQTQQAFDGYRRNEMQGYNSQGFNQQQGAVPPQPIYQQGYPPTTAQQGYSYDYQQVQQNAPYQNGYAAQMQPNPSPGSFIPQTPYSPGYTAPGYQPQQPFQQAYNNPYNQMGKLPPNNGGQPEHNPGIPLNGGGYVPQRVPVRRRAFVFKDWHLILMGAVLIALFAVSVLLLKNNILKILLIILALGSTAALWIKNLTADNKRLTYSILALALCVLTAVSFMMKPTGDQANNPGGSGKQIADDGTGQNGIPEIQEEGPRVTEEPTPGPEANNDTLMVRLVTFFTYWSENRQDEMLTLCAPSWVAKQENPRISLYTLISNRYPIDCTPETTSGTDADTSRKVTLTSSIDRGNGRKPEKYRMTVLMVKEDNEWYIDPESLQTYDAIDTPDPSITDTPAPTETPAVYSDTILYYNPKNGEYYHLDPYCRIINEKYTPLEGKFTYAEINTEPYDKLKPCNVCGAPLRP